MQACYDRKDSKEEISYVITVAANCAGTYTSDAHMHVGKLPGASLLNCKEFENVPALASQDWILNLRRQQQHHCGHRLVGMDGFEERVAARTLTCRSPLDQLVQSHWAPA